jgi:hypothetical protein
VNLIMVKGSRVEGWAPPCKLDPAALQQQVLSYDTKEIDLVHAAEAYLGGTVPLGQLHKREPTPPAETPPTLQRALVQARLSRAPNRVERATARRLFKASAAWIEFVHLYRQFVHEYVLPRWGCDLLYQATPVLRVVLPGSVAPCQPHCDADYFHDPNEINYWLPLTKVWGSNTLWAESRPGAGDFAPFELEPGQLMRFYGNRCQHFTRANETDATRVSIDFRVLPLHLHMSPKDRPREETAVMQTTFVLDAGGYYAVARVGKPYRKDGPFDHAEVMLGQESVRGECSQHSVGDVPEMQPEVLANGHRGGQGRAAVTLSVVDAAGSGEPQRDH